MNPCGGEGCFYLERGPVPLGHISAVFGFDFFKSADDLLIMCCYFYEREKTKGLISRDGCLGRGDAHSRGFCPYLIVLILLVLEEYPSPGQLLFHDILLHSPDSSFFFLAIR